LFEIALHHKFSVSNDGFCLSLFMIMPNICLLRFCAWIFKAL